MASDLVTMKHDKGSCVAVWDRDDYLSEAEKNSMLKPFIKMFHLMRKY